MEVKKWTIEGKETGVAVLNDSVFAQKAHPQTINEVVKAQRNNERQGTVSTKTRAMVSGGGRKPWRQKGTGRARCGSNRSPIWVGGGCTFGPHPRIFDHRPPKKAVDRAIIGVLTELAGNDRVRVVEKLAFDSGKTHDVVKFLAKMNFEKALFVIKDVSEKTARAAANFHGVKIVTPSNVNAYDLLKYGGIVISADAVTPLEEVLSK